MKERCYHERGENVPICLFSARFCEDFITHAPPPLSSIIQRHRLGSVTFCKTKHRNTGMRPCLVDTEVYRSQNGRKRWGNEMGQSSVFQRSVNLVYSAAIPTQIYSFYADSLEGEWFWGWGGSRWLFSGPKRTTILSKALAKCIIWQLKEGSCVIKTNFLQSLWLHWLTFT